MALEGPLTVAQYMGECLGNPNAGYYMTRDPFGQAGDFTTSPEISQMFGELLGVWAAAGWQALGEPDDLHLVEMGPGRGTLMSDALRTVKTLPKMAGAVRVHLVEMSPVLRNKQRDTIAAHHPDITPQWWNDFSQVPPGPVIVLANEFFDVLPVRQFQKTDAGWCERLLNPAAEGDGFAFGLSPAQADTPLIPGALKSRAKKGDVVEICPAGLRKAHTVAARLKSVLGLALIVDYGHGESAVGETLQAVKDHRYHDPLVDPGLADLTAHVDFQALAETAAGAGAAVFGPVDQGVFLTQMGIGERAAALAAKADNRQRREIEAAAERLTGGDQMGRLFKAMAFQHPDLPPPPGFDPA